MRLFLLGHMQRETLSCRNGESIKRKDLVGTLMEQRGELGNKEVDAGVEGVFQLKRS